MKSVDLDGQFEYSNEVEVTIGSTDGLWISEPVPNPAKSSADVQFSIGSSADVDITLFDITGKVVRNLFKGYVNAGTTPVLFDLDGLNSGVYTYVIKAGDRVVRKQIHIVK